MSNSFLETGPSNPRATILFAHGAGAAMDSPGMTMIAEALVEQDFKLVRFEFSYMADRRTGGSRRPPPKAEKLNTEYESVVAALNADGPVIIGGKSMGGRVASMVADNLFATQKILGLLCVGYPFHPIGKPEKLRTDHLKDLQTPTLICQGTRDPFGTKDEAAGYDLSPAIQLRWFEDGDHDLKPRKRISGFSHSDHMQAMAAAVAAWSDSIKA